MPLVLKTAHKKTGCNGKGKQSQKSFKSSHKTCHKAHRGNSSVTYSSKGLRAEEKDINKLVERVTFVNPGQMLYSIR